MTAFAHGELPDWHRAEISRHLLRCPACHDASSGAEDLFGRLAALGADGDAWRGEVRAAETAIAASRRTSFRAVISGAAAAAVLVAGLAFALARGGSGEEPAARVSVAGARSRAPAVAAHAPLSADESALLAAQSPDGRWSTGGGRGDEATTGLALLALAARRPHDLRDGAIGRATAAATSWLLARQRSDGRIGRAVPDVSPRDQAVATAALLEVYAATGEAALRAPVEHAVRALARRARDADRTDDSGTRWTRLALERARGLGWDRLDGAIERAGGSSAPVFGARTSGWLAAVGGMSDDRSEGDAAGTPIERAIRVLRRADHG